MSAPHAGAAEDPDWATAQAAIEHAGFDLIVLADAQPARSPAALDALAYALSEAGSRGVLVRAVLDPAWATTAFPATLLAAGVEVRALPTVARLLIADGTVALTPDPSGRTHRLPDDAAVTLSAMAETCWRVATLWSSSPSVTAREATLVTLLMSGSTDAVIASRLGVTERSVRRWVSALSDRYGVRTRLQLGAALARDPAIRS